VSVSALYGTSAASDTEMTRLITRDLTNMRQENEKNAARFEKNEN